MKCYGLPSPNSSRSDQPALAFANMSDYMRIGGIMPSRPAPRSNYPAQDALLTKPDISAAKVAVAALSRRLPAKS
jgi:hypothetical protein